MVDKAELEEIKAHVRLSDVIGRRVKLRRQGPDHFGCCPFHEERTPSFSVNDAKGFYHCFGCGAHGDVFEWFERIEGLRFLEAVDRARGEASRSAPVTRDDPDVAQRIAAARAIWAEASPIGGTVAETYLRDARRIRAPLPATLRYHPDLNWSRRHALGLPALVAAVHDVAGELVAIQRTWLRPDGLGKAEIAAPKRSLGPVRGGAVRLAPAAPTLGLAEGVETALSAMELYRLPVWAALGSNLAGVELPDAVRQVVIFADRGGAGEAAAEKARTAFAKGRRRAAVRFPRAGDDFNDELQAARP